jgi:hypothetical protein
MAISRFLMKRQLRANGGIMDVTPRENFGLGSKLKKFVRKIIPNEVADIAVKAAPFVAPFNPALAAGMSGLGTFDQTGSISAGLKSGAMNYAIGQGSRYLGGADFQGNPFSSTGGFTPGTQGSGTFSKYFSRPTGSGGIKNLFKDNAIQPIGGTEPQNIEGYLSQDAAKNVGLESERLAELASQTQDQYLANLGSTDSNSFTEKAFDLLKKGTKAAFYDSDGKIDIAAVLGAATFAASYAEALALANGAGVDLTEEEYDEAQRAEKKAEYAGYLTNFFGGKKDGGRIGFKSGYSPGIVSAALEEYNSVYGTNSSGEEILVKDLYSGGFEEFLDIYTGDAYEKKADGGRIGYGNGANEFMSEQMMLESNPGAAESGSPITIDTTMTALINKYNTYKKSAPGVSEETRIFLKNDLLKSLEDAGISQEEFMMRLSEDTEMKANGGRIGFKKGSDPVYEMYLEDLEAGTIPSDKSYNEYLDDIEEDPDYDYSYAKGGRVSRKLGSPEEGERSGVMEMLAVDVDAGGDDEEDMLMAYKPGSFYKKDFKPMEVDAINERLQSFLDMVKEEDYLFH